MAVNSGRPVLAKIEELGIEEIVSLGDTVGYGPNPRECFDLVRERSRLFIRGWMDGLALSTSKATFNPVAKMAHEWTENQFTAGGLKGLLRLPGRRERLEWLQSRPWGQATRTVGPTGIRRTRRERCSGSSRQRVPVIQATVKSGTRSWSKKTPTSLPAPTGRTPDHLDGAGGPDHGAWGVA
jgi:hypothetical protein